MDRAVDVVPYKQWTNWITQREFEMVEDKDHNGKTFMRTINKEVPKDLEVVTLLGGAYNGTKVEVDKKTLGIYYSPSGDDPLNKFEHYRRSGVGVFKAVTTK